MRGIHCVCDPLEHSVYAGQDFVVPEPENLITSLIQKLSPPLISLNLINVLSAIEFDYQSVFRTKEVHNVTPDGLLAAELGTVNLSVTQVQPQLALSVGFVTTKALGVGAECLCAALQFLLSPAYLLFIPSPMEGEGRVRGNYAAPLHIKLEALT